MGAVTQKNRPTLPLAMASDRSLSSASPSSRAPHESPCLATAGAGSSCTTQWLLPIHLESCVLYCADKVVPVEGDKGAAGVAIETTVANCSRPSEPSTAVSCAVRGAAVASRRLVKPDTAWVAVKSRGAPGSCVADDPPAGAPRQKHYMEAGSRVSLIGAPLRWTRERPD